LDYIRLADKRFPSGNYIKENMQFFSFSDNSVEKLKLKIISLGVFSRPAPLAAQVATIGRIEEYRPGNTVAQFFRQFVLLRYSKQYAIEYEVYRQSFPYLGMRLIQCGHKQMAPVRIAFQQISTCRGHDLLVLFANSQLVSQINQVFQVLLRILAQVTSSLAQHCFTHEFLGIFKHTEPPPFVTNRSPKFADARNQMAGWSLIPTFRAFHGGDNCFLTRDPPFSPPFSDMWRLNTSFL